MRHSLEKNLIQRDGESRELFALRQKIQTTLSHFYSETDKGKTIKKEEFREFHQLLYNHYQMMEDEEDSLLAKSKCMISPPGQEGYQLEVINSLMRVLEIESLYKLNGMDRTSGKGEASIHRAILGLTDHNIGKKLSSRNHELLVIQRYKFYDYENYTPLPNELPLEFDRDKGGKYALVAAAGGNEYHAVTYLKDVNNPENWIYCDDSSVKKVSSIPSQHRMIYLYYAKIND